MDAVPAAAGGCAAALGAARDAGQGLGLGAGGGGDRGAAAAVGGLGRGGGSVGGFADIAVRAGVAGGGDSAGRAGLDGGGERGHFGGDGDAGRPGRGDAGVGEGLLFGFGQAEQSAEDFGVVLAEIGCGGEDAGAGAAGAPEPAVDHPDADFGMSEGLVEAAGLELGVLVDEFEAFPDGGGGDACLAEALEDVLLAVLAGPLGELIVERVAVFPAVDLVGVGLVFGPLGGAHDEFEGVPFGVGADADGDPIVVAGAGVEVVGGHPVVAVALVLGEALVHGPVHEEFAEHGGHDFALGEVDVLAAAGAVAVDQGGGDGCCGGGAGDGVAVGDAALVWDAVVAVAGGGGEAGEHFDDRAVADGVAFGAGFAEAGHADDDDVVAQAAQPVVGEAEVVHHVGSVVFDHDVAVGEEFGEDGFALVRRRGRG